MRCISYSLFGYNKPRQAQSFDFDSYLRGLMVNVRMNRLLYPDWVNVLQTDHSTYAGFKDLFKGIKITVNINEEAPLCKAMLWRLKPVFEIDGNNHKYTHVLCRDLDSPSTFREVQAVTQWIQNEKAAHAITDSVSHNLPMMGGMIGFMPRHFWRTGKKNWDELVNVGLDYSVKGSDQTFLNKFIYPKFAEHGNDSITQHYVLGMANTFLSDFHKEIPNIDTGLQDDLRESNETCGHIGSAGYYTTSMEKFLNKYKDKFNDLREAEKKYPNIFYWTHSEMF